MKKIFALLCGLLLVASFLTGCGAKPAPAPQQSSQQVTTLTTESQKKINLTGTAEQVEANTRANSQKLQVREPQAYTDKQHVAAYINEFAKLPHNYITKGQAQKLGWKTKGTLDKVAPGKSIGGDRFGNYEGKLPRAKNRSWKECDIDYVRGNRNAKRLLYSNDGLIYYTEDHYKSFSRLY